MSFTIDRIVLREVPLTLREPFRISSGEVTARRIFLLQLHDRSGASAWSECVAGELPNYSPETIDTAWHAIRTWIAPRVLGRTFEHPQAVHALLREGIRGHEMARAAVEMGCWGLHATIEGISLRRALGGARDRVAAGISIGIQQSPDALIERAMAAAAAGYRKVKLKIQPGRDIAYVAAVRRALGSEVAVMADANSAYTPADAAHLAGLDAYDLTMIEQPLDRDDLVRHAALQQQLRTPICLDESIVSVARAEDMITLGAGRIVNIKPGRVGGYTESKAIHDVCVAHDIPVWCGGMLESGVGRAYNVALASLPGFTMPGDLSPSARYWARDLVEPEWTMIDGMVTVPDAPGIGVAVDAERIAATMVREEELRA